MRIRTGILEIDRLEDESGAPSPPLVKSIDDVPTDAEAVQISAKTRGLADLAARPRLRRVVARAFGDAELEHVGRIATLERLELAGPTCRDLRALRGLSQLRILNVSVAARLESLDGIEKLTQLQVVGIWRTPKLRSIDALAALHRIAHRFSCRRDVPSNADSVASAIVRARPARQTVAIERPCH